MTSLEKRAFELLTEALTLMQECMPDEVTDPVHATKYSMVKEKVDQATDILKLS